MRNTVKRLKHTDSALLSTYLIRFLEHLDNEVKNGRLRYMTQEERDLDKAENPGLLYPGRFK